MFGAASAHLLNQSREEKQAGETNHSGARTEAPEQTSRFVRNPRNSEAKRATFAQKWTLSVSTCLLLCGLIVFFNSDVLSYSLKYKEGT